MTDDQLWAYEREFDERPTRIGMILLHTNELLSAYINRGNVDLPVYPRPSDDDGDEIVPFVLSFIPSEARDLAGLLVYSAGRAGELDEYRCPDCGRLHHDEAENPDAPTT